MCVKMHTQNILCVLLIDYCAVILIHICFTYIDLKYIIQCNTIQCNISYHMYTYSVDCNNQHTRTLNDCHCSLVKNCTCGTIDNIKELFSPHLLLYIFCI